MSILLAWNTYLVGGLTVLFLVVCIMMVLTVLIQRPQGGGLAGAFGSGAGSGQTAFGAKTGDALTIFTIIVFVLFLAFGITLNFGYRPVPADAGDGEVRLLKSQIVPPTDPAKDAQPAPAEGDKNTATPPGAEPAPGATPPAPAGQAPQTPPTSPAPEEPKSGPETTPSPGAPK